MAINQHDSNFKQLMSHRTFFEGFFRAYLPPNLLVRLNWSSIQLYKAGGEYIEEKTSKAFESDIIYLAKFRKKPYLLWVHCEHQSRPDRMMPVRILHYQTAELLSYARKNPKQKLPGIISIIYHQGKKPWPHSVKLQDLFRDAAFYDEYFGKPILVDLQITSDDELQGHPMIGPVEMILKYVRQREELELKLPDLIGGLRGVDDNSKAIILKYVVELTQVSKEKLIQTIHEKLPEDEELFMGMTVREQFIQEGVQQGMQQGVQQGLEEGVKSVACRMLLEGVDEVFIQKITQLSFDDLKKLKREMQH